MPSSQQHAAGTGSSVVVEQCQICGAGGLKNVLFLGYMPPVNEFHPIGHKPAEQPAYPAPVLLCTECNLVQLGLIVDPAILFPPSYPYRSGTTRILRENFAQLYLETLKVKNLTPDDLVIDIGSNDGTLLSNYQTGGHRVLGIEPTDVGHQARARGIETRQDYFSPKVAAEVRASHGAAKIVTAANVFAHIEDVDSIVEGILSLLDEDGLFISESHYLMPLLETVQYDTVYHEHLRYYSLASLSHLLRKHGLEPIHAQPIPTHGGSIRVFAARTGKYKAQESVARMLAAEPVGKALEERLAAFRTQVIQSKLDLHGVIAGIKREGKTIVGVSAPSRSATLVNYVGLDDGVIDYICEVEGSLKIGKYMPGTLVPVVHEQKMLDEQPDYALLFSWHIADELIPKLRGAGFKGKFIVPLPTPRIV